MAYRYWKLKVGRFDALSWDEEKRSNRTFLTFTRQDSLNSSALKSSSSSNSSPSVGTSEEKSSVEGETSTHPERCFSAQHAWSDFASRTDVHFGSNKGDNNETNTPNQENAAASESGRSSGSSSSIGDSFIISSLDESSDHDSSASDTDYAKCHTHALVAAPNEASLSGHEEDEDEDDGSEMTVSDESDVDDDGNHEDEDDDDDSCASVHSATGMNED